MTLTTLYDLATEQSREEGCTCPAQDEHKLPETVVAVSANCPRHGRQIWAAVPIADSVTEEKMKVINQLRAEGKLDEVMQQPHGLYGYMRGYRVERRA